MEKKNSFVRVCEWIMLYSLFVCLGFILGMIYQQLLFTQEISRILSYTDVEVNINLNATKFIEELNKTFIPAWKQAFNETLKHKFPNINYSYIEVTCPIPKEVFEDGYEYNLIVVKNKSCIYEKKDETR